jgi:predicted Zn-dependent protease
VRDAPFFCAGKIPLIAGIHPDYNREMIGRYFQYLLLILPLVLSSCATNPVSGDREFVTVSESQEIDQGRKFHQTIIKQYGVYDDPDLQSYVDAIGQQLAANSHRAHLQFHFTILDSPDINAFALPGGYIYITRGIMAYLENEAELAGVIGHEIGHVTARHSVRQQSGQLAAGLLSILISSATDSETLGTLGDQLSFGILRGYGRKHELEADRLGAEYLHKSAYNPEAMLDVIGVLKDQELYETALAKKQNRQPKIYHGVFSTHPKNDDRLKTVVRAAKNLPPVQYRADNQVAYLNSIDGMTWGQNTDQGVVLRGRFLHAELGISLQFPVNWLISNNPRRLLARDPETGALTQVSLKTLGKNETSTALLKRLTKKSGLAVEQTAYGATVRTVANIAGGSQPARFSAINLDEKQVLFIAGTSTAEHFATTNLQLLAINASFARLSEEQVKNIKYPVLKIIESESGDSFASLATGSAINHEAEDILRLLNRAFPDGTIVTSQKLKVIELAN